MEKTRPFRFLAFTTYLPLPLMGIMVIFGLLGYLMQVGWLQSAPEVLLIPTLLLYYISLVMGAIYGLLKKEESVYLIAFIGIAVWVVIFILSGILALPDSTMIAVNIILIAALLVLHVLQYYYTKKWESRVATAQQYYAQRRRV
jgi:hypothetical protein